MITLGPGDDMIDKFEDLGVNEIELFEDIEGPVQPVPYEQLHKEYIAKIDARVQERLGISFDTMKQLLSDYTISHAEEMTHDFVNITPFGDYGKMLEDNDGMADFLKAEAHKVEHWHIKSIRQSEHKSMPNMITFHFYNKSVDEGESMFGYVYVNFEGKVKHAFAQADDN